MEESSDAGGYHIYYKQFLNEYEKRQAEIARLGGDDMALAQEIANLGITDLGYESFCLAEIAVALLAKRVWGSTSHKAEKRRIETIRAIKADPYLVGHWLGELGREAGWSTGDIDLLGLWLIKCIHGVCPTPKMLGKNMWFLSADLAQIETLYQRNGRKCESYDVWRLKVISGSVNLFDTNRLELSGTANLEEITSRLEERLDQLRSIIRMKDGDAYSYAKEIGYEVLAIVSKLNPSWEEEQSYSPNIKKIGEECLRLKVCMAMHYDNPRLGLSEMVESLRISLVKRIYTEDAGSVGKAYQDVLDMVGFREKSAQDKSNIKALEDDVEKLYSLVTS